MARTRTKKSSKYPPIVRKTRLIVGEGADDAAFLKYLKSLYHHRNSGWSIKIIPAQGGSPEDILIFTLKHITGAEDEVFIVLDTDKPLSKVKIAAAKHDIKLIELKPECLDCFLLELLSEPVPIRAQTCKKRLQMLLKNKKISDSGSYKTLFSKTLLDKKNKHNKTLAMLIEATGN